MAIPYRGIIIGVEGAPLNYVHAATRRMLLPVVGVGAVQLIHRGDSAYGYWIPESWLYDQAEKDEAIAHAAIDHNHQIESLKGTIKAKQKTIATLQGDRDRYGRVISEIRSKVYAALYADNHRAEAWTIGDVATTTELVDTLITTAKTQAAALKTVRQGRIADSERMGAEMSARRSFVARLRHLFYPGEAIDLNIDDAALKVVQTDIMHRVNALIVEKGSNAAAAEEIKTTLAALKSTGHKHEGRSLSDLVDMAIDTERTRHHNTLDRLSKALGQDWTVSNGRSIADARDWCSFLVNVITDHWQPKKPEEADVALETLGDVAHQAAERAETILERRLSELESRVDGLEGAPKVQR